MLKALCFSVACTQVHVLRLGPAAGSCTHSTQAEKAEIRAVFCLITQTRPPHRAAPSPLRAVAAPPGSDLPIPEVIAAASGSVPPLPSNPTPPLSAAPMGSRGQPGPCRHPRAPCEAQGPRSFSRLPLGSEPAGPLGLAPEPRHDELRIPAPLRARCPGTCDRATSPGPPGEAGGLKAGGEGLTANRITACFSAQQKISGPATGLPGSRTGRKGRRGSSNPRGIRAKGIQITSRGTSVPLMKR